MKFTLSWLKDHLDTSASLTEIVDTLTRIGLEVERVENTGAKYAGFVVARVIEAKPHPNADRLRVCMVDAGGAPVQVVCGAPNARTGMFSVFSPVGTYIPGKKITLAAGTIRGIDSNGMLCSEAELELSQDHDGIIDLPIGAPVGQAYAAYAGLDDPVIEINLTPNRPDATGVHGVARDLAAAGLGKLKSKPPAPIAGGFDCPIKLIREFSPGDEHLCPAFALRLLRGVKNGASPSWMQKRLRAIGLRPINALVDITNYITFDQGRPLHVFDAAKVHGDLHVRRAGTSESVRALDGKTYALDESMVVIADDRGVESIAGVMGGESSGCDENTRDVLIESALWDAADIAQTGRKLGIITDARYRFERGVDPDFCIPGAELATRMALDICGGDPSHLMIAGSPAKPRRVIDFPYVEVSRLTGLDIPARECDGILERLGFSVAGGKVSVPNWRPDIDGKADIVEQIIRIAGLDRVPSKPLARPPGVPKPVLTLLQKRTRLAKRTLAGLGLNEAVTWSFIAKPKAELFGGGAPELALANPIAADLSDMRPSLIPGLVAAADRNARRGLRDVALFEVGQVFLGDGENDQRMAAAALRRGLAKVEGAGRHWTGGGGGVDAFDAKSDALALLASLGVHSNAVQIVPGGPAFLHPGRCATLQFGPKTIAGWFGQLHPATCEALDAEGPLAAFEIFLDVIPAPKARPTKAKPKLERSEFMPVERDLAFLAPQSVRAADIVKAALNADRALISDASVFDLYAGKGVAEGYKSLAIALSLQPRERTLTDAEIEATVAKVVAEVSKKTGATLRG